MSTTLKKICSIFIGAVTAPASGEWIDLPASNEEIQRIIDEIQRTECEEVMISDYEGVLTVGEYDNIFELNERCADLADFSEDQLTALQELSEWVSQEEAIEIVENGQYRFYPDCWTMAEVAEIYADEIGDLDRIPEDLRCYFDFESYGRTLEINGRFARMTSEIGYIEYWF